MPSRSRSRGRRGEKKDERSRSRGKQDNRERSRDRKKEKKDDRSRSPRERKDEVIELKPGVKVRIHSLKNNPEKNGAIGTLLEFNAEKQRWAVEFPSSATHNFKVDNIEAYVSNSALDDMKDDDIPTRKIFIQNLAPDTTVEDLIKSFGSIGTIAREAVRDNRGQKQGFYDEWPPNVKISKPGRRATDAKLEYEDKCAARAAIIAFDGFKLKGNKITVCFAGQGMTFEKRELTKPWVEREENRDKIRAD